MAIARLPRLVPPTLAALGLIVFVPTASAAQEIRLENGAATLLARVGAATVVEAEGPALVGRREIYRPVQPLRLRHRWLLVQDSVAGVVFTGPAGVGTGLEDYQAEFRLRALQPVTAVEVRALVFNVWGDLAGYLSVTSLEERTAGQMWELRPRWPAEGTPMHEHRSSITWVHRVMFRDGSVLEADEDAVSAAWRFVSEEPLDALPVASLRRASGP